MTEQNAPTDSNAAGRRTFFATLGVELRVRRCMLFNWMPWHRNRSCKHGDGFAMVKATPRVRESGVLPDRD